MKTKILTLLLSLLLVAGCGAASSQIDSGSSSQEEYVPSYTYVNPDPDMKLVTSPGGDITYANYRLYLDVNEQLSRFTTRQDMAVCAALEKDFKQMGIEVDEDEYESMATQQIYNLMLYTPSISEDMQKISEITGMTQDEILECMMLKSRVEYLGYLLGNYYEGIADKDIPSSNTASSSESEAASESESSSGSSEDAAAKAEADRQQAVYDKVSEMMSEYSTELKARLSYDDESVLATLDGEAIPYTDSINNYIDYIAVANRLDAASFIQAGELVLRELERRNTDFDKTNFESTRDDYINRIKNDEVWKKHLTDFCSVYGATLDDYFRSLERPLWLQEVGDLYYIAMTDEFNSISQDSGNTVDSADSYYVQEFNKLLEGSEIVNITGK